MARRRKSEAEKYLDAIANGRIVACKKMKKLAEMYLPRFADGYKKWHFDEQAANRPVDFIQRYCKLPSGRLGKQFELERFQVARLQIAFGFVDDQGMRQHREVMTIEGRKNGKTSETAGLELHMLVGDREGAPQVYNVANSGKQAELAYNAALRIRRQSPQIKSITRKRNDDLYCERNMGFIMPLTSQTDNLDGLDAHFGVIDELSAIKNRDLYDLIKQAMGARDQPMLWVITTNGFVRNGIFDAQYEYAAKWLDGRLKDDNFLAFIYELDSRDEWKNERAWKKANPGLGTIKKVSYLREQVNKAKNDPSYLPTVLTKDFNLPENQASAWLRIDEAVNKETFDLKKMGFRYGICGFDAADTIDLNAAKIMMMRPDDDHIYELSMYWIPETVIDQYSDAGKRQGRDFVPYEQWIARGLMRTVPGNKVDKRVFVEWFREVMDELDVYPYACGFDPWHVDDATRRELEGLMGKGRVIPVRQGAMTLSQPMKQIRADYGAKRIVNNHNPIDEWCRMNVMIKTDNNGNITPVKKDLTATNRIDGFIAEVCAYKTLNDLYDEYSQVI